MDKVNFEHLKELRQRNIITEESYIKRIVDFAKIYLEKDMKLDILKLIERGTYGGKIMIKEKGSSVELAAKVVITEKCPKQYIDVWPSLKHPNIVRLLDMQHLYRSDAYIFITQHYFCNLENYLQCGMISQNRNSPEIVKSLLCDILAGLEYLHDREYSHLALKAKNILISRQNMAVISNFASLSTTKKISKSMEIPLNYGPPELSFRNDCNADVCGSYYDMWYFGILALNILTNGYIQKKIPEYSDWHDKVYPALFKILQMRKFSKHINSVFRASKIKKEVKKVKINFIITCLRINPAERPSPNMLLKHKYFLENDGFITVYKGPWAKKPLVKADFWIEALNFTPSNKPITKETLEENSSKSFIKKPSEDSKTSGKDTELIKTSKVTSKSKIDTIQNQNNNLYHKNNENKNKRIAESNSLIEETSKVYTTSSKSNDSAQIHYRDMNSEKNDILINDKLNSDISAKISNSIKVDVSLGNSTIQELELESTTSDNFSVTSIMKFVQPTFYEIDGVSQTFPKWISLQYIEKIKLPLKKGRELSSHGAINSYKNVTHEACSADNLVLQESYSNKTAKTNKINENQNSLNIKSSSSSEETIRVLNQKENKYRIPNSTFQTVKADTEELECDVGVFGDIASSNLTQQQDNKGIFEGDATNYL